MTESDTQALAAIAKDMNDGIVEQEGYDPVGESWLMRALTEAYEVGRVSYARERGDPVLLNVMTTEGRPSGKITE